MDREGSANESEVTPPRGNASSRDNERTRARVRAILDAVPGRWDAIVLDELAKGPRRPAELERAINAGRDGDKLSHAVMFAVLRKLCERDLAESEQVPGQERRTLYSITGKGRSIHRRISRLGPAGRADWWKSVPDDDLAAEKQLPGVDAAKPSTARVYDYLLGRCFL
jgi:DNA-binding HxlR family transcriptional regulator